MIEALEHEVDVCGNGRQIKEALTSRGGINGWTLVAATEGGQFTTLFWSRTCPASPNLGSEG